MEACAQQLGIDQKNVFVHRTFLGCGFGSSSGTFAAKQAAEIDILSGGRLRLGMGVGYNPIEFEALNADFKTRGKRFEEQVAVLRALWTQEEVTYKGQWHNIRDASLAISAPLCAPPPQT